jgi:hypothetical protein
MTSNNPHLAYANRTVSNTHKHGPTETTMAVLQSAQEGGCMKVLETRYIRFLETRYFQFSQQNNMIANKQVQKENDQLVELT